MLNKLLIVLLAVFYGVLPGCVQEGTVPPPDEQGQVQSPPPVGLEENPARPKSARPTPP